IVAFASIWPARGGHNLAADLVRYDPAAAEGLMDFLFIELMLWGKAQGCASFDLGMTPLPEIEERSLAPVWYDIGHRIFVHGEHFVGFSELRHFKDRFRPKWHPRYLAAPGGWRKLPRALTDAAALIKPA
ncbi:MAG: DUF2156 domain-containing protein, partial [Gammaproteobacteria bacterium]|nr:DUF2156 domain-containing protein [Gammaproteobacteria bacterium]